ncbi:hypothetical protein EDD36DRAFT_302480 [Exophiala viscosa]|uniref:Uncharacterized protein n=2 Tax=Exophiala viscosa TaxID=2486360 RepID=A0AAN6DQ08_9EURO|nr:hypothetical protein EDD36DRAFT_302480 [Exophiala viscosa]
MSSEPGQSMPAQWIELSPLSTCSSSRPRPSQTGPPPTRSPVPRSRSPSVSPSHAPTMQKAETQVVNIKKPDTRKKNLPSPHAVNKSRIKSALMLNRLSRAKKREHGLTQKMTDIKQGKEKGRQKIEELRTRQEQARLTREEQESLFENARKAFEEAQAKYQAEQDSLSHTQEVVESFCTTIGDEEDSVARFSSDERDIAKEIESLREQAARQAEFLDVKPFDLTVLAKHSVTHPAFHTKLVKIAQGAATHTARRDVKAKLFDTLTGATADEFKALAKKILSAQKEMAGGTGAERPLEARPSHSIDTSSHALKRKASSSRPKNTSKSPDDLGLNKQHSSDSGSDIPVRLRRPTKRPQPARKSKQQPNGGESNVEVSPRRPKTPPRRLKTLKARRSLVSRSNALSG